MVILWILCTEVLYVTQQSLVNINTDEAVLHTYTPGDDAATDQGAGRKDEPHSSIGALLPKQRGCKQQVVGAGYSEH